MYSLSINVPLPECVRGSMATFNSEIKIYTQLITSTLHEKLLPTNIHDC